jgi:hypothetical protein
MPPHKTRSVRYIACGALINLVISKKKMEEKKEEEERIVCEKLNIVY